MAGVSSVRSCFSYLSEYDDSLLECCICRNSMSNPVILSCLHSCCRSCAELSRSAQQTMNCSSSAIKCRLCGDATEHSSVMSNSLLYNYKHLSTLSSEVTYCSTCDVQGVAAVFWCADCCMALCESCYSWHNRFQRRHRSAELEVARTWCLSQLTPAAQCNEHKRHMEAQCFTCRAPKCLLCYESCRTRKHDLQSLSHGETRTHITAQIVAIKQRMEQLHRVLSGLQHKCRDVTGRLHGHRMNDGSTMLLKHKSSLIDGTIKAFDTSVGQVRGNLERIWVMCTTVMGRRTAFCETVTFLASNIKILLVDRLEGLKLLCANHLVKRNVNRCMSELGVSLSRRRTYWLANLAFSIDGSSPLTSDIVLRYCLGATDQRRVTTSHGPVKRNSGATPCVLDAFSHSGEFLWRHETSDEELMVGLCVSADTWSRVYVTVTRRDGSSRVMAIGGADGRDSREVLSSRTLGLQIPAWLSLARGQQRTVLAVLSWDRTADQYRTVSLYEATS